MEPRKEVGSSLIRDQARGWTVVLGCCDFVVLSGLNIFFSQRSSHLQTGFLFPSDNLWQFSSFQLHSFLKNHQNLDSSNTDPTWSSAQSAVVKKQGSRLQEGTREELQFCPGYFLLLPSLLHLSFCVVCSHFKSVTL